MNQNINTNFPPPYNFNIVQLPIIEPHNYFILPYTSGPFWSHPSQVQQPKQTVGSPTTAMPTIKQQYIPSQQQEPNSQPLNGSQISQQKLGKGRKRAREKQLKQRIKVQESNQYRAKYYDPSQAPVLTSIKQFLIQRSCQKKVKSKNRNHQGKHQYNEMDYEQSDSAPFIVFKHRRIKKKYRKYVKNQYDISFLNQEENSSNLSENQSACILSPEKIKTISKKAVVCSKNHKKSQL